MEDRYEVGKIAGREWASQQLKTKSRSTVHQILFEKRAKYVSGTDPSRFDEGLLDGAEEALRSTDAV